MPNERLLNMNKGFNKAWESFVESGTLKNEFIRKVIFESWMRCKIKQIDPLSDIKQIKLDNSELIERHKKLDSLLKTAKPFMNSLKKIIGSAGFVIRLTDKDGYVLVCGGDKKIIAKNGDVILSEGYCVKEQVIGTNALGTSLEIGEPLQVFGAEHYCKHYHNWTSSACPIRVNKEIVGVLSVTGPYEKAHPHTLGMVVAAAQAIENQMKLDQINKTLTISNKNFKAIMESISEGIISLDNYGTIRKMNSFAGKLLSIREADVIGKNIESLLHKDNSVNLVSLIKNDKKYEEEIFFRNKRGKKIPCIVNITPIKDVSTNTINGIVMTFKEAKVVHSLVNKIVGADAKFTFEDILGSSKEIKDTIKFASMAAKTDATVLLLGESGTGKEMFAQAIHNESRRKRKPFVFLNCGAIPRELVASELFGYVEGAFTGAKIGGHPGKFELANGGTIFLDEIGDMPLDTQANLLRVLETKEIVRVGGHDVIPIDVRVIAATHKNLEREVERGNFRRDLFYRLNVMPIHTPALRERKEDIKIFIDYFLDKFNIANNKSIKGINDNFYMGMMSYDWPGNVRELQNVMQLIINTLGDKEVLGYEHLPKHMKSVKSTDNKMMFDDLCSLDEIEKNAIETTIKRVNGNIALAAKVLGIGRSTLYRKIDKYNIEIVLK